MDKSFESICDFDLLIDSEEATNFEDFLHELNFKKKFSSANYVYPGFADYLGFDEYSGKIFHFHIHYKLIVGKKNQKNYRIPIEKLILDTAVPHDTFPIRTILPELEFLLLIIRSLLKFSFDLKTIKRILLKRKVFPQNILEEFRYLSEKIDHELFSNYCNDLFSDLSWLFRVFCFKSPEQISLLWLMIARYRLNRSLKNFQIYQGSQFANQRRIRIRAAKNNLSWLSNGGISIAFVGVDGAGKTTTISLIRTWLISKLSVQTYYMGLPKGDFIWEFIRLFYRIFKKLKINWLSDKINLLRNIYSATSKYKTFLDSERVKNQGNIVLFDRYPLKNLGNLDEPIDGPVSQSSPFWQALEKKYYEKIKPPDYLFVLLTDHEDAINRKSEHQSTFKQNQIREKTRAIFQLVKSNQNSLIPVNSSRNQDEVLLEIKNKIWGVL
ncbi:MAG: hypothetical protein O6943_08765 [Bacteroidetes bacterium]|nr:hypothetical protein [Bacteroidota bacterium]